MKGGGEKRLRTRSPNFCLRKVFSSSLQIINLILILILNSAESLAEFRDPTKNKQLNCLLITIDTLRADRLSSYGARLVQTPSIDALARKGILFSRAFAHTTTTLPSHTNILLGLTPPFHGVHDNVNFILDPAFVTAAELAKSAGYATAAFVGSYSLDSRFGLNQGFDLYDDDYGNQDFRNPHYVERRADAVVGRALAWLQDRKAPWFLWVHCFDPHVPYDPPEPFKTQYKNHSYEGEIAFTDSELGRLFDHLEKNGLYESTLVVLTSDHGESLGEHGEETHGYFAYNTTLHVPLIIRAPGLKPGREDSFVSHIDILPTVCSLLKIRPPKNLQGRSLLSARGRTNQETRPVYFESLYPYYSRGWAPLRGLIAQGKKFISSPIPEVYDLEHDFQEEKNLAGTAPLDSWRKDLRSLIERFSNPNPKPAAGLSIDREALEKLRSLGYISTSLPGQEGRFTEADDVKTLLPLNNRVFEAMALDEKGRTEEAVRNIEEILKANPKVDVAHTNLALLYKKQGRLDKALDVLKLGLVNLPENYEVFLTCISYLLAAKEYDELIRVFMEKPLFQKANDPEIWNSLGVAYANKGDFPNAIPAYEKALAIDGDFPDAFVNLGAVYFFLSRRSQSREDYQKSLANFSKALALDPRNVAALNGLGAAYREAGDLGQAVTHWKKALDINPRHEAALYNLGLTELQRGNKTEALEYLTRFKDFFYLSLSDEEKARVDALIRKAKGDSSPDTKPSAGFFID